MTTLAPSCLPASEHSFLYVDSFPGSGWPESTHLENQLYHTAPLNVTLPAACGIEAELPLKCCKLREKIVSSEENVLDLQLVFCAFKNLSGFIGRLLCRANLNSNHVSSPFDVAIANGVE